MNLGYLTVRLQAFASFCMTRAEIKEPLKGSGGEIDGKGKKKKKNHIINQNFIQKECFHRQDRIYETRRTCSSYTTKK